MLNENGCLFAKLLDRFSDFILHIIIPITFDTILNFNILFFAFSVVQKKIITVSK